MELTATAQFLLDNFGQLDYAVTEAIHNLFYPLAAFFSPFFDFISFLAIDGIPLIIASIILMCFKKTRRIGLGMAIGMLIGFLITNLWLKVAVARPRPYLFDGYREMWQLVGQRTESDMSFPSGHVTGLSSSLVGLQTAAKNKKFWWIVLIMIILMSLARIYLVVHYFTDVVGAWFIGIPSGIIGGKLAVRIMKNKE